MTTSPVLLREAVERAIMRYDPIRTSETDIEIEVQDSTIILHGYVRSDVMRNVASQLAQNVNGVRSVRNNLYSDSDLEIMVAQAIELRLGTYIVPMMPVVRVIRGHVFLRGPVPSEGAKAIVEETARLVPGVILVHNLLDVDALATERLVAPKKVERAAGGLGAAGGQAMVGGKPVTAEDLPAWALKPKAQWGMAEYKARAKAKLVFKRGEGPDPSEMEAAGAILGGGGADEAGLGDGTVGDIPPAIEEPTAALEPEGAAAPDSAEAEEDEVQAGATAAAVVDMDALRGQFPAWALKPKEEWDKDDFKAQMQAKRAAKSGEGDAPETIIERAQAALEAARSAGTKKKGAGPKNAQEAAIAAVRAQYPGWAIGPPKEWRAQDFQEAAEARVAELRGKGQGVSETRTQAQAALEAAMRGEAVAGGGVATRRELTPEEVAGVRQGLLGQYPAWALKAKDDWDKDDFKGQMAAKRAAKGGEGDAPETIIEKAQAALEAALKAARDALPLEGGNGGSPTATATAPAAAGTAGPREITPDLLARFPGWALKPKEQWSADEFKAHAKAKSAAKKGEGPDPDSVIAEAQAALG
jgi:hypothetical protein